MARAKAVVMIGHSHLGPIRGGLSLMAPKSRRGAEGHFFVHDVWAKRTPYADSAPEGGVAFNAEVMRLIDEVVPRDMPRCYVGTLGGNGHVLLALARHPRPFDFILPERPELPRDEAAELLPYEFFLEALKPLMMPYVWQMVAFRQAIGESFLCVETPPPYGDDSYVATHLGDYVPNPDAIVSRVSRYKCWRAHSYLLRFFCRHNDVDFLPAPRESMDEEGFLKREFYGADATHGNDRYGQLVVRQIEEKYDLAFKDVRVFS